MAHLRLTLLLALGVLAAVLTGCGGGSTTRTGTAIDVEGPPDITPIAEPKSKYGNMASYVVLGRRYHTKSSSKNFVERGQASWYGSKFHGRRTSSGEVYDMHLMTAAHKTLPLPTYVRVTNLENGRSTVVRVNDRGPFHGGRIIDLSYAAAKKLGVVAAGTARVEVRSVDPRDHGRRVDSPKLAQQALETRETSPANVAAGSDEGLFLQVGAFDELANAEQLRHRLVAYVPEPVNIRPSAEADPAPYKVHVGPLGSRAEAEAVSRRLATLGLSDGLVISP